MRPASWKILAGCLALASAPMAIAQLPGAEAYALAASTDQPLTSVRFTYPVATPGLADEVAQSGLVTVRLDAATEVQVRVREYDIFVPGEKVVRYYDEAGALVREEPILARTFLGEVVETGERATFTIAPEGLYGALKYRGVEYSFQPRSWQDGDVEQEVVHDVLPADAPPSADALHALLPPPSTASAEAATYKLYVKPMAELSFRNWASDWENRIINGYFYAASMWSSETNIEIKLHSPAATQNFPSSTTCNGSGQDLGIQEAKSWVWANGISSTNSYGLWHGNDGYPDQAGCAASDCDQSPSGCLQQYGASMPRMNAIHAVQAVDLFSSDGYDASRSDHLGKAAAHELSHNAGEPDHPSDGACWMHGTYNLMHQTASMGCTGTWRTATTISRIQSYSAPFLTGP